MTFIFGGLLFGGRSMKRTVTLPVFALIMGLVTAFAKPVIAAEPPTASAMTSYIQNARTPEDHEYIASIFHIAAVTAESIADSYGAANQFTCQHSQAAELQRHGVRFSGVTAQRRCRKMLHHYANEAKQLRQLAGYHRAVAESWRADSR
jgi:hypothetical protein